VFWDLGGLRHIDGCTLEFICCLYERQIPETTGHFTFLKGCEENPAFALLACTGGTSETMDVGFALAGKTDLDDVRDIGEIHSTEGCCVSETSI
jgi:hypothetical protein